MKELTKKQAEVLEFIKQRQQSGAPAPTLREIAAHFGFRSPRAAACHLEALQRKGALEHQAGKARFWRARSPLEKWRRPVADIPLFGAIPAGFPDDREQMAEGCVSVDVGSLGFKPTARTFALRVRGDSMIGRHILDGDIVVLEHGLSPRPGDVVAALIDNESTLKTFVIEGGRPCLRAENPKYPKLIPAGELVIQGVMVGLIRRGRAGGAMR
jgi:repressor LexA